jgi:hypothetical protein
MSPLWRGPRQASKEKGVSDSDHAFAYVTFAAKIISLAKTVDDLNRWWKAEADHRSDYGVTNGSPEWKALVEACADRKAAIILKVA